MVVQEGGGGLGLSRRMVGRRRCGLGGEQLLDPLMVRFEANHIVRDLLDYLAEEGFEVQGVTRLKWEQSSEPWRASHRQRPWPP
jgi:hypothetical protein